MSAEMGNEMVIRQHAHLRLTKVLLLPELASDCLFIKSPKTVHEFSPPSAVRPSAPFSNDESLQVASHRPTTPTKNIAMKKTRAIDSTIRRRLLLQRQWRDSASLRYVY